MIQLITNRTFGNVFQIYCLLVYSPAFSLIFELNIPENIQEDIFFIMVDSFSIPLNGVL